MKTFICRKCKKELYLEQFHKNKRRKNGYQHWCKVCKLEQEKVYYKRNHKIRKEKSKKRMERNRLFVYNYLLKHSCTDCGETNPIVLEFDHVKGNKRKEISNMVHSFSLDSIIKEIDKCEIVCSNCHRIRTAKQLKWWIFDQCNNSNLIPKTKRLGHR